MQFHADHDAIRQFGHTVRGLADDADTAVGYTREHLGIGYDEGRMFFTVVEKATEVRDALMNNYQLLAKFADQSGAEVVKAADMQAGRVQRPVRHYHHPGRRHPGP